MKFTKEIKENWLKALKSGEYTQCKESLHNTTEKLGNRIGHCCIGVLGDILPFLDNNYSYDCNLKSPYEFLTDNLGHGKTRDIFMRNDNTYNYTKPDYSNVIPLIEQLETKD